MSFTKFLKNSWVMMNGFFSYLGSVALFPPGAIICENESDALVVKSLIYRVHLAIRGSSENMEP